MRPNLKTPTRRRCGLFLTACVIILSAPGTAAAAVSPEDAVALLNEWRGRVGVPPVSHDPAQSAGCQAHAEYVRHNGESGHSEDPARPGYTDAGHEAARSSVLSYGEQAAGGPFRWEWAPYHRTSLLNPRLATTGFWGTERFACMGVFGIDRGRRAPVVSAHPYPTQGQTEVPLEFTCNETPNPCTQVPGNPGDRPTGPIATVQFDGPWAYAAPVVHAASLVAADGTPVAVTTEDSTSPRAANLDGGISLIPHQPLRPGTTYTATISGALNALLEDRTRITHPFQTTWAFTTRTRPRSPDDELLEIVARVDTLTGHISARVAAPGPFTLTATDPAGAVHQLAPTALPVPATRSDGATHAATLTQRARPGRWRLCAAALIAGQPIPKTICTVLHVRARHHVRLRRVNRRTLEVTVGAWTRGRAVRVILVDTRYRCRPLGPTRECGHFRTSRRSTLVVRAQRSRKVRLPSWASHRRSIVWAQARVAAGTSGGYRLPAYSTPSRPLPTLDRVGDR